MTVENGDTPVSEVVVDAPVVDAPVVETPAEPKSMDDTIRDTLRDLKSKGAEIPADVKETPEEAAKRIRDDKGRFAKTELIKDAPVAGATMPAATLTTPAEPQAVPPEVQRLGFRKEAAEAYMQAPDVLKQEIQRRSDEMHQGMEQVRSKAQFGDTMERVLAPYQQTFQKLNVSPDKAISELMGADARLRNGDVAYLSFLADNYGFDRAHLAQVFGGQVQLENPINPQVMALQQEVQRLSGMFQEQQSSVQQRADAELNSTLAAFEADPKHSHFPAVRGHMAALLRAGQAKDLGDAYEQAIYANPTTRALVIAEQQTKARAEAAQKAQAAKDAASVNVRKRPSMPPSTPIGSMDDTIRSTLRNIQAR